MVQVYCKDGVVIDWNESATFNVKVGGFGHWMATECWTQNGVESLADAVLAANAWIKAWQKCAGCEDAGQMADLGWGDYYCRVHSVV